MIIYVEKKSLANCEAFVEPNGENANKYNKHLELILDFMGVLEYEIDLWEQIKKA